jgi:hypothetical protein
MTAWMAAMAYIGVAGIMAAIQGKWCLSLYIMNIVHSVFLHDVHCYTSYTKPFRLSSKHATYNVQKEGKYSQIRLYLHIEVSRGVYHVKYASCTAVLPLKNTEVNRA